MKNEELTRFYDTCSLLEAGDKIFAAKRRFLISSITLKELENIKTSSRKDELLKYKARHLLHLFEENQDLYEVIVHRTSYEIVLTEADLEINNDSKILSDAFHTKEPIVFVTNDLALKTIANIFFYPDYIDSVETNEDEYTGFLEVQADCDLQEKFYSNPDENIFDLKTNQYLLFKDENGDMIDLRIWDGTTHRHLQDAMFNSTWLGKIQPIKNDPYQKMVVDSFLRNKITIVKGLPGSGKTYLSLGYLMHLLDRGRIDKIIVFCNTVAAANSARLGFYPGSRIEKLLDSQIGNLLASKLGGIEGVQQLIDNNQLLLLPLSDIRGFDTSGMRAGIYITEAQNLDRTLMKLALQRVGEDSICIIDGDNKTQVDLQAYAGPNNGMHRASEVFRGQDFYGEVELQICHRSKIAEIAENI